MVPCSYQAIDPAGGIRAPRVSRALWRPPFVAGMGSHEASLRGDVTQLTGMIMDLEVRDEDLTQVAAAAIRLEEAGDINGAVSLYKVGVSLGDLTCMTRLADVLSEPPTFMNVGLAEQLYKRACIAGHAPGCRNLAIMYKQLGKSALHDRYMALAKTRGDVWQLDE